MAYIGSQFLDNKYTNWYMGIVESAKVRNWNKTNSPVYTEKHHVVPSSLGGTNDVTNLVCVTAREHFILHWLLTKMIDNRDKYKMRFALYAMSMKSKTNINRVLTSRQFERARIEFSEGLKDYYKTNISKSKGLRRSKETIEKIKLARAKQITTEETKQKMSVITKNLVWVYHKETLKNSRIPKDKVDDYKSQGYVLGRYGYGTPETRNKLSEIAKQQWIRQKGKL